MMQAYLLTQNQLVDSLTYSGDVAMTHSVSLLVEYFTQPTINLWASFHHLCGEKVRQSTHSCKLTGMTAWQKLGSNP